MKGAGRVGQVRGSEVSLVLERGCGLVPDHPVPGPQEGRSLPAVWSTSKLFRWMGGDGQLIIYEQGTGSWRGCVWPWGRETVEGGVRASYQSGVEKGSSSLEAISWNSEGRGGSSATTSPHPFRSTSHSSSGKFMIGARAASVGSGQEGQDHVRDGGNACRHQHLEAEPPVCGGSTIPSTFLHGAEGGNQALYPLYAL